MCYWWLLFFGVVGITGIASCWSLLDSLALNCFYYCVDFTLTFGIIMASRNMIKVSNFANSVSLSQVSFGQPIFTNGTGVRIYF